MLQLRLRAARRAPFALDDIREALADSDAQVLSKEDALRLIAGR
jgi:hypothetical protein